MRITPFSFDENTSPRQWPACVIFITPPYVTAGCIGSSTTRFLPAAAKSSAQRSSRRQLGRVMYVGVRHTTITLAAHSASLNRRTTSSTFCARVKKTEACDINTKFQCYRHRAKQKREPSRAHSAAHEWHHLVDAQHVHPHVDQRLILNRLFQMTHKLGRAVAPRVADEDGALRRKEVRHFVTCSAMMVTWQTRAHRQHEPAPYNGAGACDSAHAPATISCMFLQRAPVIDDSSNASASDPLCLNCTHRLLGPSRRPQLSKRAPKLQLSIVSSAHFTLNLNSPKSLDATHSTQLNVSET